MLVYLGGIKRGSRDDYGTVSSWFIDGASKAGVARIAHQDTDLQMMDVNDGE